MKKENLIIEGSYLNKCVLKPVLGFLIVFSTLLLCQTAQAGPPSAERSAMARLGHESAKDSQKLRRAPVKLRGGSVLTLISPEVWTPLIKQLSRTLTSLHEEYTLLLGEVPAFSSSIRLMDENSFFILTGAPSWTNAMFYKGEILIPLSSQTSIDYDNLYRSVRHEYTHAVVHAASNGKCPGWMDEGLAQWAEGPENSALSAALAVWLKKHSPVPLAALQGGFTRLDTAMVPAAYAQSLFATNSILNTYGFDRLKVFFKLLRQGNQKPAAFKGAFGISEASFEDMLGSSLGRWKDSRALEKHQVHSH